MNSITNIAGYKFIDLQNLPEKKQTLTKLCQKNALKGTILLASEGINIMLAGNSTKIIHFKNALTQFPEFTDLEFKESGSEVIPFQRLKIKIKKEIITFDQPNIAPTKMTGQYLSPQEFKHWLDQKKDMIVLDTRNRCEVSVGKFSQAMTLELDHFRHFPIAIEHLPAELKNKPIVMYCTGGIRCEKASAYMLQQGFQEVYQLEGGILKYLTECGSSHYEGQCFVFDERGAISSDS